MGRRHTLFLIVRTSSDSFEEFAKLFRGFEIDFVVCHRLNEFWYLWFTEIVYPAYPDDNTPEVDRAAKRFNETLKNAGRTIDGFGIYIRWDGSDHTRFEKVYESDCTFTVCIETKDGKIVVCKKREDYCVELRSPLSIVWLAVEWVTSEALAYKHSPKVILYKRCDKEPHAEDPLFAIQKKMKTVRKDCQFVCRYYIAEDEEERQLILSQRLGSYSLVRSESGDILTIVEDELAIVVDADIASVEKIKAERAKVKAIEDIRAEVHSALGWILRMADAARADAAERGLAFDRARKIKAKETAEDQATETAEDQPAEDQPAEDQPAEDQPKETAEDQVEETAETAEDQVEETAEDQVEETAETAEDQVEETAETAETAEDQVEETAETAEDQVEETAEDQASGDQSDSSLEYELGSIERAMAEFGFYEVGSKEHKETKNMAQKVSDLCKDLEKL